MQDGAAVVDLVVAGGQLGDRGGDEGAGPAVLPGKMGHLSGPLEQCRALHPDDVAGVGYLIPKPEGPLVEALRLGEAIDGGRGRGRVDGREEGPTRISGGKPVVGQPGRPDVPRPSRARRLR